MTKTVNDLYFEIRDLLKKEDMPSPALCAKELCAFATGLEKKDSSSWGYKYLFDEDVQKTYELANRYIGGEPLAYIIGEWDFYDETFKVTPDVLIPRADTESLVEYTIQKADAIHAPKVLDLCSGSGCIGITIAKHVEDAKVVSVDISEKALAITRENSRNILKDNSRHLVVLGDALSEDTVRFGNFNIIVCNPPYIESETIQKLDSSVKDFEPLLALDGGKDGLDFYRAISDNFRKNLFDGGYLIFECGINQQFDIADIMHNLGYEDINIIKDLTGTDRIVCGRYKERELGE